MTIQRTAGEELQTGPIDPEDAAAAAAPATQQQADPQPRRIVDDEFNQRLIDQRADELLNKRLADMARDAGVQNVAPKAKSGRDTLATSLRDKLFLEDSEINPLLDPVFTGIEEAAYEAAAANVAQDIAVAGYALLPDDATREAFKASLPKDGVNQAIWLKNFLEFGAPKTKAYTDAVEAAYKEGWADRAGAPAGMQPQRNGTQNQASAQKTFEQLRAGYGAGTLSADEDTEYTRQLDERARSR